MSNNTLEKREIAFPCHKYIVRHINTEAEKLEYARAFFSKMNEQGMTLKDMINNYVSTALFQEERHLDFLSYKGKLLSDELFYCSVMEDPYIPCYKNCQAYIKKYGNELTSVCKVCPYFFKYVNDNKEKELAILKKINSSYSSLQLFMDLSKASYFKSCIDFAQNTPSSLPFIVPFLRLCYNIIKSYSTGYYEQKIIEMSDRQRLSMLQNRIYNELKSKYKIDTLLPNHTRIFPLLYASLLNEILLAEDITDDDMASLLSTKDKKICNNDVISSSQNHLESITCFKTEHSSCKPVESQKDGFHKDHSLACIPTKSNKQINNSEALRSFTNTALSPNEVHIPSPEDNKAALPSKQKNAKKICSKESQQSSDSLLQIDEIPLPHVEYEFLSKYMLPFDDSNIELMTDSIEKNGNMPLECIIDESGSYVIISWIQTIGKAFYSPFFSLPAKILKIFSHSHIRKICYQSFYIHALCKLYGIQIKNVYSLYSIHSYALNTNCNLRYTDIFKLYNSPKYPKLYTEKNPLLNAYISGMPLYEDIYRIHTALISKNPKYAAKADRLQSIDEVLGTSFFRSLSFYDESKLLTIKNGKLLFNHVFHKAVKKEGHLLTYIIENNEIELETKHKIYFDLLSELSKKGYIRKVNFQLVTIYDGIMILFLGKECHEFLTTYIHIHLYRIALTHGYEILNIKILNSYCIPMNEI